MKIQKCPTYSRVCLAWKSGLGKTVNSSFLVNILKSMDGKPGGLTVEISEFIKGTAGKPASAIDKLPQIMQNEINSLLGQRVDIHDSSLDFHGVNYIKLPK